MKIFGIAGFKNAGKTTLVVELVRYFSACGLRVATIKHAHHEFDIDHPGKDSYLHRSAGAAEVIVVSARRRAHIVEHGQYDAPELDTLLRQIGAADLVLIEGFKHDLHPKIEIRREDDDSALLAAEHESVVAIACDGEIDAAPVPVFARDDVSGIAGFILEQTGLQGSVSGNQGQRE